MPRKSNAAPKDLNAPKRPQSSYFLFSNERRPQLQVQYKDKKVTDIAKMIAQEWKAMEESQKKPYNEKAVDLKKKYDEDIAAYKKTDNYKEYEKRLKQFKQDKKDGEVEASGKGKKGKGGKGGKPPPKPKDANAPKRAQSAYFFFSNVRRPKLRADNKDLKMTEIAKLTGEEWKNLSSEEKKPYEDQAAVDKERYQKEQEAYTKTDNYKKFQQKLADWKRQGKEQAKGGGKAAKKKKEESSEDGSSTGDSDETEESSDDNNSSSGEESSSSEDDE